MIDSVSEPYTRRCMQCMFCCMVLGVCKEIYCQLFFDRIWSCALKRAGAYWKKIHLLLQPWHLQTWLNMYIHSNQTCSNTKKSTNDNKMAWHVVTVLERGREGKDEKEERFELVGPECYVLLYGYGRWMK